MTTKPEATTSQLPPAGCLPTIHGAGIRDVADFVKQHLDVLPVTVPHPEVADQTVPVVAVPEGRELKSLKPFLDEFRTKPERRSGTAETFRYGRLPPQTEPVAYFAAHNAKFERLFLEGYLPALPWICTWKCALVAWPDAPSHGNQVLRYWLNPEGIDRALAQPAHRAGPDAYATAFTLRELLKTYSIDQLVEISSQPALLPRVPFGKQKGAKWSEVDDGFLDWILVRDFDSDVLHTARTELNRRRSEDQQADHDKEEAL